MGEKKKMMFLIKMKLENITNPVLRSLKKKKKVKKHVPRSGPERFVRKHETLAT